jgi:4-aminobutyrate aminotransferase/(S)-3-amino-2-methylpropionate transaminase
MGDPSKLLLLQGVLEVVRRDSLLDLVQRSGEKLLAGLRSFEREFPELLHSARGRGTFLSVACSSARLRDDLVARLKKKGKVHYLNTNIEVNVTCPSNNNPTDYY